MHRALIVLAASVILDTLLGIAFALTEHISVWTGLYFATTTATTVGYGDVTPHGAGGHIIAVLMMLTVIPLFSAVFSLLTTALTSKHMDSKHEELKKLHEAHASEIRALHVKTDGLLHHVKGVPNGGSCGYQAVNRKSDRGEHGASASDIG